MLQKLSNSWRLVKASARVLQADKELLVFPLVSGLAVILVSASFFLPLVFTGAASERLASGDANVLAYAVFFLFYLCQYFVIIFFNTALVGAAMIRLDGGNPTLGDGLRLAMSRLGPIFGYAMIAATVGLLLRALRERAEGLASLAVGFLGMAWSLATFLVVPILASREIGPLEAVKESARLLKRTWGEQVAGNFGLGAVFVLIYLGLLVAGIAAVAAALMSGVMAVAVTTAAVVVLAFVLTALVQSALSGIYAAALYRFATTGEVGAGFDQHLLADAFVAR
ncbi:MAG: hypothetical protein D6696_08775 [Acidobacteria bacterium]|nr:MAG: hypothetical protein D6696_08775 [Acidobacteriota bacterium]